jgi:DNA ligase (NAD+)
MAKQITDIAPSIEDIDQLTVAQVEALPGFGDVKAQSFIDGWKELRSEIRTLNKYVKAVQLKPDSDILAGKKFCFTGSFSVKRTELEATVVANGGKKGSSVGKDTILVWDESISGSKYDKAVKLNCQIINEEEFEKMLEV